MAIEARDTIVDMLDADEQALLVAEVRDIVRQAPLFKPSAKGQPMTVRITNAGPWGWVADERGYRYQSGRPVQGEDFNFGRGARYSLVDNPWPKMPERWKLLADRWDFGAHWDCAHIVWYDPAERDGKGAQLGWHRDKTEHDLSGTIVTVSLGDPAEFWVRENEDSKPSRVILNSGAVVVFKGPSRNVLHRVARVLPSDMFHPSPLGKPGRIALSIRSGAGPWSGPDPYDQRPVIARDPGQ